MKYYERKECRLCGCKKFYTALELTPTPWADDYVSSSNLEKKHDIIPLTVVICEECGHGQLTHVIDATEVYLNYTYETASTLGLGDHFKTSADYIIKKFNPKKNGVAVDIGSNDGILLKYFQDYGMDVLGIDPMPGIAEKATSNGINTWSDFFDKNTVKKIKDKHGHVDIITSNNLVADTDDLDDFISNIASLMNEESIFFFETFYFYLQIKNFVWDFTYHEHYSYFTVKPLINYFKKHGLELIDVSPNLTKGGSMRCCLQKIGGKYSIDNSVNDYIELENKFNLPSKKLFQDYSDKIKNHKENFVKLINKLSKEGNKIDGYGASATTTTLVHHYDLGNELRYIYDDFKVKQGLYSPGHHIPVLPSNEIYNRKPDYIVIIAWRYYEKIISKHKDYLKSGGKFIVPLPELKIISE